MLRLQDRAGARRGLNVDNCVIIGIREHYAFLADIHGQMKDIPDGTKIRLVVGPKVRG
jgi:hypothetical protein